MKLVVEIPDEALKLVAQDVDKYLGPLMLSFGASVIELIKSAKSEEN